MRVFQPLFFISGHVRSLANVNIAPRLMERMLWTHLNVEISRIKKSARKRDSRRNLFCINRLEKHTSLFGFTLPPSSSSPKGVQLDDLDQGLCRGDPLLCVPSQLRGSSQQQHAQANRYRLG